MSSVKTIPTFITTNGVSADNIDTEAPVPEISTVVATLYNTYKPSVAETPMVAADLNGRNNINLNTYSQNGVVDGDGAISQCDFLNLFYATNAGYFNVNPANLNNSAIAFSSQTYSTSNSSTIQFSLYQYLLKAYLSSNNISRNDIDPRILILLKREVFQAESLADIQGTCVSLTWDNVISDLVSSGLIAKKGGSEQSAVVNLQVLLNYHSSVLNFDLQIIFNYLVSLDNYMNVECAANGTPSP